MDVDVLTGSDYYWNVFSGLVCRGENGSVALESIFGWVLSGPIAVGSEASQRSAMLNSAHAMFVDTKTEFENFGTWKL